MSRTIKWHTLLTILSMIQLIRSNNIIEPCDFSDTINLTGSVKLTNGYYLHDDVMYPPNLVGIYDYTIENVTSRQPVESHLRGCLCKIKICINLCCQKNQYYNSNLKDCMERNNSKINTYVEMRQNDNTLIMVDVYKRFGIITKRPCQFMYDIDEERHPEDEWTLYENGEIFMVELKQSVSRNEFCFTPKPSKTKNVIFNPRICSGEIKKDVIDHINSFTLLFSLPFMIITIAVYILIPELRNLHGKSLACYLFSLAVVYSILAYFLIMTGSFIDQTICTILGYIKYYFFMASFFWLSVISFDLWWNFLGTMEIKRTTEMKRFIIYSIYSWGLAFSFLCIVLIAQYSELPTHLKPGIGGGTFCYLDLRLWIQLLYFFGPAALIIIFNIIMFIMTAMKICKVQKEIHQTMSTVENKQNLHNEKDRIGLFLRLFIIMGLTWALQIISWIMGNKYQFIFYISDIFNAGHGFLIFVLFVLKKRVKNLIIKRYRGMRGKRKGPNNTSRSNTSSNVPMAYMTIKKEEVI